MEKNLETMSMDELRTLALESINNPGQEAQEQPRDEQGRFVQKETPKPEETPTEEVEEQIVYRRTIDLGDGSGVQVFEAPTLEELIDKLAKAQEHATRKIREQEQRLKEKPQQAEVELTPEQKFILQQRMLSEPDKVIEQFVDETFKKKYGPKIEEIETHNKIVKAREAEQAWVDSHPDYYPNEKNGKRMMKYLETYQLEINNENLQKAFEDLSESGLLEARPAEAPTETAAEPVSEAAPARRIVEPTVTTTTVKRKVVGAVTTKRSAPVEQTTPGLTEDELYKLPMAELERMTLQHFKQ